MERNSPVYTTRTECQDCFKCVRNCPAKAIRIKDAHAEVIPELCVACGRCLEVCPAKAKRVRDDLSKVSALLKSGKAHASVAPSWVSEFPDFEAGELCSMLKALGFTGVSETAIGAQNVSSGVAEELRRPGSKAIISSACPAAKEFVRVHIPEWASAISTLPSPLLEHARVIKARFGSDSKVVFIGPCVAKKLEADNHPELLDLALGFDDIRKFLKEKGLDESSFKGHSEPFELAPAEEGALYPLEGGMIETLRVLKDVPNHTSIAISGLTSLRAALSGIKPDAVKGPMLIECLACRGGCVNGPCMNKAIAGIERLATIRRTAKLPGSEVVREVALALLEKLDAPVVEREPTAIQLEAALRQVGQDSKDDELNCGGCGYDSCINFARALALGRAEPTMCASYMRKLANNKANALLKSMPCGVVIVDSAMKIIECNEKFAEMLDEGTKLAFEARPGLAGANIHKMVSFGDIFKEALETGRDIERPHFRMGERLYDLSIFTIDPKSTVGATISDVTGAEFKREQIAKKAREVITKNLTAVQDIAWRLGEHMADTEILLRSIAEGYSSAAPSGEWKDVTDSAEKEDEP